jgi:hypothetical protein
MSFPWKRESILLMNNWSIGELGNWPIKKILINFFTSCLKPSKFGNNIDRKENKDIYEKLKKANRQTTDFVFWRIGRLEDWTINYKLNKRRKLKCYG